MAPVKQPLVKPTRKAKRTAKRKIGGTHHGEFEGLFTDDKETAGIPPTEPKKKTCS